MRICAVRGEADFAGRQGVQRLVKVALPASDCVGRVDGYVVDITLDPTKPLFGANSALKAIMAQALDPEAFAQRQLDAYNARDLDRFVREYAEDVVVYRLPDPNPVIVGRAALAAHYRDNRFNLPKLHAKLVNRMVFGNKVIDQELVVGVPGAPLEVAAIYEVSGQGICRVWFVGSQ